MANHSDNGFAIGDHVIINSEGHIWDMMDGFVTGRDGEERDITLTPPFQHITTMVTTSQVFPYPDLEALEEVW